jgi:hypothetical protein
VHKFSIICNGITTSKTRSKFVCKSQLLLEESKTVSLSKSHVHITIINSIVLTNSNNKITTTPKPPYQLTIPSPIPSKLVSNSPFAVISTHTPPLFFSTPTCSSNHVSHPSRSLRLWAPLRPSPRGRLLPRKSRRCSGDGLSIPHRTNTEKGF